MRIQLTAGLCFVLMFSFFGCAKLKAKRLDGTYHCTVNQNSYFMGEYSDTTFACDLVIVAEDGVLRVDTWDDFLVPVKSLDKNDCYHLGSSSYWQEICFSGESVAYSIGHQFHNSSGLTTYVGRRN